MWWLAAKQGQIFLKPKRFGLCIVLMKRPGRAAAPFKNRTMKTSCGTNRGFTLIELLVVIGIIGILVSMLMPSLIRAKQKANSIKCVNDIRQLAFSASMYSGDHNDEYPRRRHFTNSWIFALQPYFKDEKILKCPADNFFEGRSYLINGWNDYWQATLPPDEYKAVMEWRYDHGMKQEKVPLPSDTILFGEKRRGSYHVHMDFGQDAGNDKQEVNHNMHRSGGPKSGGSNFAFVDGSVRFLKYGGSVKPVNLWAITDVWRSAPVELE